MANILSVASIGAWAALPTNAILNYTPATGGTTQPPLGSGSWFSMKVSATTTIYTAIDSLNGIQLGTVQGASGSHSGLPGCTPNSACNNAGENPNIDKPWGFFSNTGMHQTTIAPVVLTDDGGGNATVNMSGWDVTWNGIPTIPMGAGVWGNSNVFSEGVGNIVCAADCSGGDNYTLDYHGTVPQNDPSGFGGVKYGLHLEGVVGVPGTPPLAVADPGHNTILGNTLNIDVTANDIANGSLLAGSVQIATPASSGVATAKSDNTVDYSPLPQNALGQATFGYKVSNSSGLSNEATVTVSVQANVAPVANDDTLNTNTGALDNAGGSLVISVLANDTDANNSPGLPGGIDTTSVTVISQPSIGTCTANPDGTITYSQPGAAVAVTTSCSYQISDIDNAATPLTSSATVNINVQAISSDWPATLPANTIPILFFEPGIPGDPVDSSVPAKGGTYFTMQVTPTTIIYTVMKPASSGGFVIGHDQPAGNSHSGEPTGNEETAIDQGWSFFSNTGFSFTKNGGIVGNPDGTLQFGGDPAVNGGQGRYIITWNGIPEIDLGGSSAFPEDLGFGIITCTPAPCADQSAFQLQYAAHVPPGDPSGFGGVPYTLFVKGTVAFLNSTLNSSVGTIVSQNRMNAFDVATTNPDPGVELQCVGDCFDYTITGVPASPNDKVSIVLPLAGGVPKNPVWRILDNGTWRSFDTTVDTIKSAPFVPGSSTCPAPNDAAYRALTAGDYCIQLTIQDNGPNDLDPTVGTISDPSGMGSGGSAGGGTVFVDTRTSETSGCTIAKAPTGLLKHAEWWLLGGFLALLGWERRRQS